MTGKKGQTRAYGFKTIEKHCMSCGQVLKLNNARDVKRKKFCSRFCAAKYRWQIGVFKGRLATPETKEKMRQARARLNATGWKPVGWKAYGLPLRVSGRGYICKGAQRYHRIMAEQILGRKLKKGEVVHHIDENKLNNSFDNLIVLSRSDHTKLHIAKRRKYA